jgi:hypothetical protein
MAQQPPEGWQPAPSGQQPQQPPGWGAPPGQPPGWGPPPPGQPGWGSPSAPPPRDARPWYKKKRFIIPLALALLLIVAGVFGSDDQGTNPSASQQTTSPEATEAPAPTNETGGATTPAPTAAPKPVALSPQTINGRGKTATKAFTVADGIAVFRLQHRGQSNFIVDLLTSRGEEVANLVNEIGTFTGSTAEGLGAGRYLFKVEADGPWTIRIEQPRPTSGRGLPASASGRGPTLAGPFQGTGEGARFELSHQGEANFIVDTLDVDGQEVENLANEIGRFQGSTVSGVPEGVFWLKVQADGRWTVVIRKL